MQSDAFYHAAIDRLTALGPRHVWSLVVTVFGDLARKRGDEIEGTALSAVLSEMHVRPEAIRVALHRLRGDDWIVSRKVGRNSRHALSRKGQRESTAAARRIYRRPDDMPTAGCLVIVEATNETLQNKLRAAGFVQLMPRVFVGSDAGHAPAGALTLALQDVPDWLGRQIEPEDLSRDYAALHEVLTEIWRDLPDHLTLSHRQIAVLRSLIVHAWRRLVLRHSDLPPHLHSPEWDGERCRDLVFRLLDRLPCPTLAELHAAR